MSVVLNVLTSLNFGTIEPFLSLNFKVILISKDSTIIIIYDHNKNIIHSFNKSPDTNFINDVLCSNKCLIIHTFPCDIVQNIKLSHFTLQYWLHTAERILERLGIQTSSLFVKI